MDNYEEDYSEDVSDCCGASIVFEDICSECKEHAGVQEWDELDETPAEMNDHLRSIGN